MLYDIVLIIFISILKNKKRGEGVQKCNSVNTTGKKTEIVFVTQHLPLHPQKITYA
jgi:hypothetical protein